MLQKKKNCKNSEHVDNLTCLFKFKIIIKEDNFIVIIFNLKCHINNQNIKIKKFDA